MHDLALRVGVRECLAKLAHPARQFRWFEMSRRMVQLARGQRLARNILHGDGGGAHVLDEVIDPHDVRMGEVKAAAGLALEIAHRLPVHGHNLRQELQGHLALQLLVARQPHDPHATTAQDLFQRVPVEDLLAGGEALDRRAEIKIVHGAGR